MVSGLLSNLNKRARYYRENKDAFVVHNKKHYQKHKEEIKQKREERIEHRGGYSVCEILKTHHENTKNDPEALSTEFIQNLIGVECDN